MEIHSLAKLLAKFSSILLELSDLYLPPALPSFSSSNWPALRSSRELLCTPPDVELGDKVSSIEYQ